MKGFIEALGRFASSWTGTIIIVLFLIFFVAQSFVIPSGSMKQTLPMVIMGISLIPVAQLLLMLM